MSLYPILLLAGVVADAWLAAYGLLRFRRTLAKLAYLALLLDFIVMTSAVAGIALGGLGGEWTAVALWSFVLAHPLAALFLLLAIHGEDLLRRYPYVLGILAPAPLLACRTHADPIRPYACLPEFAQLGAEAFLLKRSTFVCAHVPIARLFLTACTRCSVR